GHARDSIRHHEHTPLSREIEQNDRMTSLPVTLVESDLLAVRGHPQTHDDALRLVKNLTRGKFDPRAGTRYGPQKSQFASFPIPVGFLNVFRDFARHAA